MLWLTSARSSYVHINGYLKFRSELHGSFRIHQWANASSRMHAEGTQALCKREVWRMPTRVKPHLVVTIKRRASGRVRVAEGREAKVRQRWCRIHVLILSSSSCFSLFFYSIPVIKGAPRLVRGHMRVWYPHGSHTNRLISFFVSCATVPCLHF